MVIFNSYVSHYQRVPSIQRLCLAHIFRSDHRLVFVHETIR